jgi:glycerate 2-kinase
MTRWDRLRLRRASAAVLRAGVAAVDPVRLVRQNLRRRGDVLRAGGEIYRLGRGRVAMVAVGKAAGLMAGAAEEILGGRLAAAIAVDTTAAAPLQRTTLHLAGHPIPDARGVEAASKVEALAASLGRDDLLLLLLSGGASALLPAPVANVSLAEKAAVTQALLHDGASITELNVVRKHLSRLKGGGLARAAAPARVACLVLSDVVGDDLATIASGPAAPDPSTYEDARHILVQRGLWEQAPASVRDHIEAGLAGDRRETAKPGVVVFRRVRTRLIGSNRLALAAAAAEARRLGFRVLILTSRLEGEARAVGGVLTAILRECVESGRPVAPPVCLLAGGETTVTVLGEGRGGRNQELVLGAVAPLALFPVAAVVAALGTDGIDGTSTAAGAVADQLSARRAGGAGLASPAVFLEANDSCAFFAPLGDLIVTGPTGTNVADLTVLLAGTRARDAQLGL